MAYARVPAAACARSTSARATAGWWPPRWPRLRRR